MSKKEKKDSKPSVPFDPLLAEKLQDPEIAAGYLNAAIADFLEDGDLHTFNVLLHDLAKVKTVKKVSEESGISRTHLYKIFDGSSQLTFSSMIKLLHSAGFDLIVKPVEKLS